MSKGLHDDAKKLLGMMGKKKAAQRPMASSKKAVKKAEPTKVMAKPAKKTNPVAAQPKKVPEKVRKASMQKPVAKSAPKAKMPSANKAEKSSGMKAKPKMAPRAKEIASEMAADAEFGALARDLPKGGKKMAMEAAEHLAPTATSKAEMAGIKGGFKKAAGKMAPKLVAGGMLGGMAGSMLAGPAGLGLAALMEAVDAEDSNPASHDVAAERAAKTYAADNPRFDYGRTAPKAQLQNKLPSEVKAASIRKMDFTPDARGDNPDQAKMENEYAKELKKWPR